MLWTRWKPVAPLRFTTEAAEGNRGGWRGRRAGYQLSILRLGMHGNLASFAMKFAAAAAQVPFEVRELHSAANSIVSRWLPAGFCWRACWRASSRF